MRKFLSIPIILLSTTAFAHEYCGHVGQPECRDGWRASNQSSPPAASAAKPSPAPAPAPAPLASVSPVSTPLDKCPLAKIKLCSTAKKRGFLPDGSIEAAACAGFIKPKGDLIDLVSCTESETEQPVRTAAASSTGKTASLSGWMYGNREDQESPGRVDYAATETFIINPKGSLGGACNPISMDGGTITLTAKRVSSCPGIQPYLDHAAAAQNQGDRRAKWTGGMISAPAGQEVRPGQGVEFDARMDAVTGHGAGGWLYTSDQGPGGCQNCEIDIFDSVGMADAVEEHVHNGSPLSEKNWGVNKAQWNRYGLTRAADGQSVTFWMNGQQRQTVSTPGNEWKVPMHLILSNAGNSSFPTSSGVDSMAFQVKNIVYK